MTGMPPSQSDIYRSLGELEAAYKTVEKLENRLDVTMTKIELALEKINHRLTKMENREIERKGAWKVLVVISSVVSGIAASIGTVLLKGWVN